MIQPIKFNDDPLMKDIPETATKFEYENMIIVILHPEKKEFDWLIINKGTPGVYYHMYQEKGEVYFHKTYFENGRKKRASIDIEKSMKRLGDMLSGLFSKVEKVELNDKRFEDEIVYFLLTHELHIKEKTKEKVIFGQNYDVKEVQFIKIDTMTNQLGFIFDENDKEKDMIFIKNGNIFRLELKHLEEENSNSFF